jgi:hypothetical protein
VRALELFLTRELNPMVASYLSGSGASAPAPLPPLTVSEPELQSGPDD